MLDFFGPTRLFSGADCLDEHKSELTALGKRVFIVTSPTSGRESGALDDLCAALDELGMAWICFDEVEQNPSLETVCRAGDLARAEQCDGVIGVGGGSPLDAAKAVAAYAVLPEGTEPVALFDFAPDRKSLPLAAIPTTAGTGSEVNDHAVLTLNGQKKRNFKVRQNYPLLAFLDEKYTRSQPQKVAVATALDALCHCVEAYLRPGATPFTDALALAAMRKIWRGLARLESDSDDAFSRQQTLEGAAMGGLVIALVGTGMPHPMGYSLSLFKGIYHGAATALFLPAHIRMTQTVRPERTEMVLNTLQTTATGLARFIETWSGLSEPLTPEEIAQYIGLVRDTKSLYNGYIPVEPDKMEEMYKILPRCP